MTFPETSPKETCGLFFLKNGRFGTKRAQKKPDDLVSTATP